MAKTVERSTTVLESDRRRVRRLLPRLPRDAFTGYLFILPVLIVIIGIVGVPFIYSLWMSLYDRIAGFPDPPFVGLDNYLALFRNRAYWNAVSLSLTYCVVVVAARLVIGLGLALLLNQPFPLRGLWRALAMLPWASPLLVVVLVWYFMLNDVNGVLNWLLIWSGLSSAPVSWLGSLETTFPTVVAISVWRGFPFFAITLLAAMQSIPRELYEAAEVDGATAVDRFWHITIPGIRPVLLVVTLLATIWTFGEFTVIWNLTRGGPGDATTVLPVFTYSLAIVGGEIGRGAAVSITVVPLLMLLIWLLIRSMAKEDTR